MAGTVISYHTVAVAGLEWPLDQLSPRDRALARPLQTRTRDERLGARHRPTDDLTAYLCNCHAARGTGGRMAVGAMSRPCIYSPISGHSPHATAMSAMVKRSVSPHAHIQLLAP